MKDETHAVTVTEVKHDSAKALLVVLDDSRELWIPKSQIVSESEVQGAGDTGELLMTQWIAEQKELV